MALGLRGQREDCCEGQCPRSGEKVGEMQQEGLRAPGGTVRCSRENTPPRPNRNSLFLQQRRRHLSWEECEKEVEEGFLRKYLCGLVYCLFQSHSPDAQRQSTTLSTRRSPLPFRSSPLPWRASGPSNMPCPLLTQATSTWASLPPAPEHTNWGAKREPYVSDLGGPA